MTCLSRLGDKLSPDEETVFINLLRNKDYLADQIRVMDKTRFDEQQSRDPPHAAHTSWFMMAIVL